MYLPKSKYRTGLQTAGNSLLIESTKEPYTGPYFETFSGEMYTGTSPLQKGAQKLVFNETVSEQPPELITPEQYDIIRQDVEALKLRVTEPVNLHYPVPSEENYSKGELLRYFLRDKTIGRILEVRKDVYESISKKEIKYYYPKYELLALSWSLRNVGSNRTVIQLAEKRLPGISSYLKDPSQFVK